MSDSRIFLSPPWTDESDRQAVLRAFESGYIAPCGPQVTEFEAALTRSTERSYAVAVSSGTAAIDLIMAHYGVDETWTILAPSLTFIATVGPAYHRGAHLAFVESRASDWTIDPVALARALADVHRERPHDRLMVIPVDLYGNCADYGSICRVCEKYGALVIADSAEAQGSFTSEGAPAGKSGTAAILSFNGNKMVTTSGGGVVLTDDAALAEHVRKLSQQSREPCVWYEHKEVGYNYRLSNVLAALGLAQLARLPQNIATRQARLTRYRSFFPAGSVLDSANAWLGVVLLGSAAERDALSARFDAANIETRPVWKPLHLQPVFRDVPFYSQAEGGISVAEDCFNRGLCLPMATVEKPGEWTRIQAVLEDFNQFR